MGFRQSFDLTENRTQISNNINGRKYNLGKNLWSAIVSQLLLLFNIIIIASCYALQLLVTVLKCRVKIKEISLSEIVFQP